MVGDRGLMGRLLRVYVFRLWFGRRGFCVGTGSILYFLRVLVLSIL